MSDRNVIDALCAAYEAECASLLSHMHHSQPFVSWLDASDRDVVLRMVAEEDNHKHQLADVLLSLDEVPPPGRFGLETSAVAYLHLNSLLPRLVADKRRLIAAYEALSPSAAANREAAGLVSRLLERHRAHLAELERIAASHRKATAKAGG